MTFRGTNLKVQWDTSLSPCGNDGHRHTVEETAEAAENIRYTITRMKTGEVILAFEGKDALKELHFLRDSWD